MAFVNLREEMVDGDDDDDDVNNDDDNDDTGRVRPQIT